MALFDIGILVTAANAATAPLRNLGRDLDNVDKKGQNAQNRLRAIHVVLAGIATGVLAGFGKNLVEIAGDFQQLEIRLGQVSGGLENGRKLFDDLRSAIVGSGLEIKPLVDGLVRLRAAGVDLELATSVIKGTADAVAAFGGSSEELKRASIALGQIASKGVVMMEELKGQLAEAIPSAMRIFAQETNRTVAQVIRDIKTGTVSANEFLEAVNRGFQKEYGGIAQALKNTVKGSLSSIKEDFKSAINDLFGRRTNANDQLTSLFQGINKVITDFIKSLDQTDIDNFFGALRKGTDVALKLAQSIGQVISVIAQIAGTVATVLQAVGSDTLTYGLIGRVLFGTKGMIAGALIGLLNDINDIAKNTFGNAASSVQQILGSLGIAAELGLIGLLFLGPAGAALFTIVIFTIDQILTYARDQAQTFVPLLLATGQTAAAQALLTLKQQGDQTKSVFTNLSTSIGDMIRNARGSAKSTKNLTITEELFGTPEQIKAIGDNVKKLGDRNTAGEIVRGLSISGTKALDELGKLAERVGAQVDSALGPGAAKAAKTQIQLNHLMTALKADRAELAKLEKISNPSANQKAQAEALRAELETADKTIKAIQSTMSTGIGEGVKSLRDKVTDALDSIIDKLNVFQEKFGGTKMSNELAKVEQEFNKIIRDLENRLVLAEKLNKYTGKDQELVTSINDQLSRANDLKAKALAYTKAEYELKNKVFAIEQQLLQMDVQSKLTALQRENRGIVGTLLSNDITDQVQDKRMALKRQELEITKQIGELELKRQTVGDEQKEQIDATITSLETLRQASLNAIQSTNEYAVLSRDFWKDVKNSITTALSDGIYGLATGTAKASDVLKQFWQSLTKAAANYLAKLIEVYLQQQLIAAFGGTNTGTGLAGFGAFAKGGVFGGNIKPFANGDIIRGPTLFGLAGEAGTEAIMPLERIGGKLGVRTTGSGGDNYNITVSAIDTKSGMQFLMENINTTIRGINHQRRLNRGPDKGR